MVVWMWVCPISCWRAGREIPHRTISEANVCRTDADWHGGPHYTSDDGGTGSGVLQRSWVVRGGDPSRKRTERLSWSEVVPVAGNFGAPRWSRRAKAARVAYFLCRGRGCAYRPGGDLQAGDPGSPGSAGHRVTSRRPRRDPERYESCPRTWRPPRRRAD